MSESEKRQDPESSKIGGQEPGSSAPLKRIDVPTRVLRWEAMTFADILIYQTRLLLAIEALEQRFQDRRLIPAIRKRVKNKLRKARRELARANREEEQRKRELGLADESRT